MRKSTTVTVVMLAMLLSWNMAVSIRAQEIQSENTDPVSSVGEIQSENTHLVASTDEMAAQEEVVEEGMIPLYADSLNEGTYEIEVLSSSSMFRIAQCQLTVEDGEISALMMIQSDSYLRLFLGTGAEAVKASDDEYIPFELNEDGWQLYEVPVEALDMGIDCAAFSRRREKWYDRTLVFSAASLPQDAFQDSVILTAEELGLEDGSYTVEVLLEGGSGKTKVESPARINVSDGMVTAVVTIISPHYNYVMVHGDKYERISEEGNSSFEIPVGGFDFRIQFIANSTAMGASHEIDYTLFFDSETIRKAE